MLGVFNNIQDEQKEEEKEKKTHTERNSISIVKYIKRSILLLHKITLKQAKMSPRGLYLLGFRSTICT